MTQSAITKVTLYFDPFCPWTFIASRWLRKVALETGIPLEFKPFSMAIKNRSKVVTEQFRSETELSLAALRVVAKIRGVYDDFEANSLVSEFYLRFGEQFHIAGTRDGTDLGLILEEFSFKEEIILARDDVALDDVIEESMTEAIALVGDDVGVPIIAITSNGTQQGFFGPILCRVPEDSEVLELWAHLVGLSQLGCFFELKRKKFFGPLVA